MVNAIVVANPAQFPDLQLVQSDSAAIGDLWDGLEFIKPVAPVATVEDLKRVRATEVAAIKVTTAAGNAFDGHEDAQNRMSRAIQMMSDADVLPWVLADNSVAQVGRGELQEALRLAGLAMAEIWVRPYLNG